MIARSGEIKFSNGVIGYIFECGFGGPWEIRFCLRPIPGAYAYSNERPINLRGAFASDWHAENAIARHYGTTPESCRYIG